MLTKEEIEKRFNTIKETHDKLKEHPYWLNFDNIFLEDILSLFDRLSSNVWGISDNTNPYYALITHTLFIHDFNTMLFKIRMSIRDGRFQEEWKDHMGDVIMVLQVYLQNIHRLIDNYIPGENEGVVGYLYYRPTYKPFPHPLRTGVVKFQVFKGEEDEFYPYMILDKNKIPNLIKYLKSIVCLDQGATESWSNDCLREIEEGKNIIGDYYRIE